MKQRLAHSCHHATVFSAVDCDSYCVYLLPFPLSSPLAAPLFFTSPPLPLEAGTLYLPPFPIPFPSLPFSFPSPSYPCK